MMKVVIRRVLVMPFLLLGIVTATFILAQFTKGNPLVSIIGARALNNPEIVAAQKKSQKKPSLKSAKHKLTEQEYTRYFKKVEANLADAARTVERLELDLKRIKNTLKGFPRDPYCPIHGAACSTHRS